MTKVASEMLQERSTLLYCKLMKYIRWLRGDRFNRVVWRIAGILTSLYNDTYLLKGIEKHSGKSLRILYVGNIYSMRYIAKLLFSGHPDIQKNSRIFVKRVGKLIGVENADMLIVCCDGFFSKLFPNDFDFIIPEWLKFELDTSPPLSVIERGFSSGAKKDVKRIISRGYTYELTEDPIVKKFFYRKMFLPYTIKRYKDEILPHYPIYVKYLTDMRGMKLLMVRDRDGNDVVGGLVKFSGDKAILPSMGVLNGDERYLKEYAVAALFYFHILVAKQHNVKRINFGNTRPFMNDGNFQFKRKWGMEISPSDTMTNVYLIKIMNLSPAVESFLTNNPFVFVDPVSNDLSGFLYTKIIDPSNLIKLAKRYLTLGMNSLYICSPSKYNKELLSRMKDLHNATVYNSLEVRMETHKMLNEEMICLKISKRVS